MVERKIVWQKWIDPLAPENYDEVEYNESEDEDYRPYIDSYEKMERHSNKNIGPALIGPIGIIPLTESNIPSKNFKFWIGHTNFDIDAHTTKQIELCPGVETLDIFTRYRFRISIGKLFKTRDVCAAITKMLCQNLEKIPKLPIDLVKKQLSSKYQYWAIFALPDGKLETTGSNDEYFVKKIVKDKENEGVKVIAKSDG